MPPENYLRRFGGGRSSCFHGTTNNGSRRLQFWVAKMDSGQRQAVAIKYDLSADWYGLSEKINRSSIRLSGVAVKNGVRCFYLRTTHGVVMEVVEDLEARGVQPWFSVNVPASRSSSGVLATDCMVKFTEDGAPKCYFRESFSNKVVVYDDITTPAAYSAVFTPVPL